MTSVLPDFTKINFWAWANQSIFSLVKIAILVVALKAKSFGWIDQETSTTLIDSSAVLGVLAASWVQNYFTQKKIAIAFEAPPPPSPDLKNQFTAIGKTIVTVPIAQPQPPPST